eukprot:3338015-Amphidinium_carterae.1
MLHCGRVQRMGGQRGWYKITSTCEDPNIDPWERECFENALSKMQKERLQSVSFCSGGHGAESGGLQGYSWVVVLDALTTPYEKIKQEVQFMKDCQHPHIMAAQVCGVTLLNIHNYQALASDARDCWRKTRHSTLL